MNSFSDVIAKWPSYKEFAADMGVPVTTAQTWCYRDTIPNRRWKRLMSAAKGRGIKGVTPALLGSLEPGAAVTERVA